MDSILFTRIKELCGKHNITIAKLEQEIGLAVANIHKWRKTSSPSIEKVMLVARYFNVSSDYLIGLTEIPDPVDALIGDDDFVSLQRARSKMSEKDNARMMGMLRIGFEYAFQDDFENECE